GGTSRLGTSTLGLREAGPANRRPQEEAGRCKGGSSGTAGKTAQLVLELGGVVATEVERLTVDGPRFLGVAERGIDVSEVLADRGIVRHETRRALEVELRLVELTELEVRPAQRIDVGPVPGIELDGTLREADGFVEVLALLGQHVAEIVERRRVVGLPFEDAAQQPQSGLALAGALVGRCQSV